MNAHATGTRGRWWLPLVVGTLLLTSAHVARGQGPAAPATEPLPGAAASTPTQDAPAPTWLDARPEVLGLRLQRLGADGPWRLTETGDAIPHTVHHPSAGGSPRLHILAQGDGAHCQRALADTLLKRHGSGHVNLPLPTLGGSQLWADVFWHGGWRIQRHVFSFHHRLLDPDDVRRAWGTAEACRAVFEDTRARGRVSAHPPRQLVLLLHGLGRTRASLDGLGRALRAEGLEVAAISYPSTRATIEEHAERLDGLIARLEGVERLSFVTHSLGGIVTRALLARPSPWRERVSLGRVVMLAPPNRGSALAATLDSLVFEAVLGPSGQQLAGDTIEALPAPPCPFGIVAAGSEDGSGYNPLLEGDDDGVVSVAEALLPGAADVLVVQGLHTFLMDDREVQAATARFLRSGRFSEPPDEREGLRR